MASPVGYRYEGLQAETECKQGSLVVEERGQEDGKTAVIDTSDHLTTPAKFSEKFKKKEKKKR